MAKIWLHCEFLFLLPISLLCGKSKLLGIQRTVITGAPGTGKTSVVNTLEAEGYYCFHEVIRAMTAQARKEETNKVQVSNPLAFVEDPLEFNKLLLKLRLDHFLKASKLNLDQCFFDRGMPDVLAYMDFFEQEYDEKFIAKCKSHKYDFLFVMPPWKDIYVEDHERLETYAEAEQLHYHLIDTYKRFGYTPILVPKDTVENRVGFILDHLNNDS